MMKMSNYDQIMVYTIMAKSVAVHETLHKGGKLPMVTVEVVTIGNALTLLYANILLQ